MQPCWQRATHLWYSLGRAAGPSARLELPEPPQTSASRVWWPRLQQEQWDCAQHLQHLGCLIFSASVGCHNLKHFRNSRIHQMQTISKELLSYQMRLRHIIKIIFFSWILYRLFYSSNAWKESQLDFNIVSIKESLQNALTRMEAKSPCRKVKKKIPNEHSFYMKRGHILHVIRARAVFPSSSFTNMFIYWQLSVLPDMLKFTKICWSSVLWNICFNKKFVQIWWLRLIRLLKLGRYSKNLINTS